MKSAKGKQPILPILILIAMFSSVFIYRKMYIDNLKSEFIVLQGKIKNCSSKYGIEYCYTANGKNYSNGFMTSNHCYLGLSCDLVSKHLNTSIFTIIASKTDPENSVILLNKSDFIQYKQKYTDYNKKICNELEICNCQ
ncbi:MAG: hypothetical protein ACOVSR_13125 [Bacteroidia bacterium]